jgi:hypothetical protein
MNAIEFATAMSTNVYTIEFEKVDGTMRKMVCTRMSDKILEAEKESIKRNTKAIDETTTSVSVYDIEISQWRSVRPASIKTMEVV